MSSLLFASSRRYLLRHPLQTGLAVGGVALGVALAVAIDLAAGSAHRAFDLSTESLTGRASHQIVAGPAGVPEELFPRLVLAGIYPLAPVLEERVRAVMGPPAPSLSLHLLGIDPWSEAPFRQVLGGLSGEADLGALLTDPDRVLLPATLAERLGLVAGSALLLEGGGGRRRQVIVAGTFAVPAGPRGDSFRSLVVADLATAQEILGAAGRLTRIDLRLPSGPDGQAAETKVRSLLPPACQLLSTQDQAAGTRAMTAAFETNLRALSLLGLLCGMFLVFNTARFSVVQRRRLFGQLRALGVTGRQLSRMILAEAALLGLVGALLGLILGILLGGGLVRLVAQTINDLYYSLEVQRLTLSPTPLLRGLLLGLGSSLLGAWFPAREAARAKPRSTLSGAEGEATSRRRLRPAVLSGCLLLAGGGALLIPPLPLSVAFLGLLALVLGYALTTPAATVVLVRLLDRPVGRFLGLAGSLGCRGVTASLSRTGVAIAALTVALATTVGIGVMIDSFRSSVVRWLDSTLYADLYISAPTLASDRHAAPLPEALAEAIAARPEVARLRGTRRTQLETPQGPLKIAVIQVDEDRKSGYNLLTGSPKQAWRRLREEETVLVSEPLAYRRGLAVGDTLALPTDGGPRPFQVVGIYRDYGSDQGVALMSRRIYQSRWADRGFDTFSLELRPGADEGALRLAIEDLAGTDRELVLRSNRQLREYSLEIFDRTFLITGVLRLLAAAVAFLGVIGALVALLLERRREIAMLQANGMVRAQVRTLVLVQTGTMGLVAGLLALPLGLVLAMVMTQVINRRSFGWTMDFVLSPGLLLETLGLAVAAALLAALVPALRLSRSSISEGLRQE